MKSQLGARHAAASLAIMVTAASVCRPVSALDFNGSTYARNASLDTDLDVFWTIDTDLAIIRMAVHAKKASGWAGVGISEMGGMEGADIAFYETETGNVTDAHAITSGKPTTDECTQDWTLVSAEVGTDGLVFEAERALDTGDSQDRAIVDDSEDGVLPTRLLAAWGDDEAISYHYTNVAKGQVILFGGVENSNVDLLDEIASSPNVSVFDVTARNFTIPATRTWYEETCLPASELPALDEFHVIGFEGVIQNSTSEYVHHLILRAYTGTDDCGASCLEWFEENYASLFSSYDDSSRSSYTAQNSSSTSSGNWSSPFSDIELPSFCTYDFADIFAWAPGSVDYDLPEDVGFRFGNASGGFTSVLVETHYNNPNEDTGMVDDSGVRVYYTEELRPMDMGVMQLGDPSVALDGSRLPDGKSSISFECPSSCTEENFEDQSVTVFSHVLHMHENGQLLQTRQYRTNSSGDEVLVHTVDVEYYSFLQAGAHVVMQNDSVTIQKGDRFETVCNYDTSLSSLDSDNVTFGHGSENEMCIDFVYYYPSQYVPSSGSCGLWACNGSLMNFSELDSDSDFNRTFGIVDTCTGTVEEEDSTPISSSTIALPGFGLFLLTAVVVLALAGRTIVGAHLV